MTDIDYVALIADRAAGTPGEWAVEINKLTWGWVDVIGPSISVGAPTQATDLRLADEVLRKADARRIARLPDLEAAYLDLHDEVKRLRAERDRFEAALEEIADGLKGIARDIQIGPDDEGREIYEMAKAMQWDARQALKGQTNE